MHEIHFRDERTPHEIRCLLEREMMALLAPVEDGSRLSFRATTVLNGAMHRVELRFEAALPREGNCYSFRVELVTGGESGAKPGAQPPDTAWWFRLWTRNFVPGPPPLRDEGSVEKYRALMAKALVAEAHLVDVESIQQEILSAMRRGRTYSTAHKEGGTILGFERGRFVRTDYGDSNSREEFRDEAAFLAFLLKFYDWETSKNTHPVKVPEIVAWRLTLRLLRPVEVGRGGRPQWLGSVYGPGWSLSRIVAWGVVLGLAAWLGAARWLGKYSGANGRPHKVQKLDTVPPMPRMPEQPKFAPPPRP